MNLSPLLLDLEKAKELLSQFSGGYSGSYMSAQEFYQDFIDRLTKLNRGQLEVLNEFQCWFAPTSCWDDFTNGEGIDLGNKIYSKLLDFRKELIAINLESIESIEDLHNRFKFELRFPEFYGSNWDAFWDSITGLTEMPKILELTNWKIFSKQYLSDSQLLFKIVQEFNKEFPKNRIVIKE